MYKGRPDLGHIGAPTWLILSSLRDGPKDGQTILVAIGRSRGIRLEPATFYTILAHMEQRHWIEATIPADQHRIYQLTEAGSLVLHQHTTAPDEEVVVSDLDEGLSGDNDAPVTQRNTIAARLVRLYPRSWRERYEKELLIALQQYHLRLATIIDLLRGALIAHLTSQDNRAREVVSTNRLRTASVTFICVFPIFLFAFYYWASQVDDPPGFLNSILAVLTASNFTIQNSSITIGIGFSCVLVAVLISSLCIAIKMMRYAISAHRKSGMSIRVVPVFATIGTLAMLTTLIANIVWGLTIWSGIAWMSSSSQELLNWLTHWIIDVTLMALATLPALFVLLRAYRTLIKSGTTPASTLPAHTNVKRSAT